MLVCLLAFDTDTLAARLLRNVGVVHAHVNTVAGRGVDETTTTGDIAADIVHIAVGWIFLLYWVSMGNLSAFSVGPNIR